MTTVQAILGVTLAVNPEFTRPDLPVSAAGGIGCDWLLGEQGDTDGGQLYVTVVPTAVATSADITALTAKSPGCDTDPDLVTSNGGCRVSFVTGGWWVDASPYVFTSASAQEAAAVRLESTVRAALVGKTAPTVTALPAISCAAVDVAISPTDSLNLGAFTVQLDADSHRPGSAAAIATGFVGETHCGWQTTGSETSFDVAVFPKSRAVFDTCTRAGSTVSSVPGVLKVVTFAPGPDGGATLCATDGTSTAVMDGPVASQTVIAPWTDDQLTQASKILVPALRLASS